MNISTQSVVMMLANIWEFSSPQKSLEDRKDPYKLDTICADVHGENLIFFQVKDSPLFFISSTNSFRKRRS